MSNSKPLEGENERSSYNFSLNELEECEKIIWKCQEKVSFKLKRDKTGSDPVLIEKIENGTVTEYIDYSDVYIASPETTDTINTSFEIEICSISYRDNKNWIGTLFSDDVYIKNIMLPGTHDSASIGTLSRWPWRCQESPLKIQLEAGIRLLDIRLKAAGEDMDKLYFVTCHGNVGSQTKVNEFEPFQSVLNTCHDFLQTNVGEFIVMSIKIDDYGNFVGAEADVRKALSKQLLDFEDGVQLFMEFDDYQLGDVKKKIVIIDRYNTDEDNETAINRWAWQWKDNMAFDVNVNTQKLTKPVKVRVQDYYKNFYQPSEKLKAIKSTIEVNRYEYPFVINFCSCFMPYSMSFMKLDLNDDVIKYLGNKIEDEHKKVNLGWFLFDFALTGYETKNTKNYTYLNVVSALIDANKELHELYNYTLK